MSARHIISLLMENEAGALSRVAGLFSARAGRRVSIRGACRGERQRILDLAQKNLALFVQKSDFHRLGEEVQKALVQPEGRPALTKRMVLRYMKEVAPPAWLEEHGDQIVVHHLPSYSPELNLDERLNCSLKSKLGQLPAAKDERTLHRQTLGQLRSCHRQPDLIKTFFTSSTTSYAA